MADSTGRAYGRRVEEHFKGFGLTLVGQGREWLESCSRGWNEASMWGVDDVRAIADGLRLASSMARAHLGVDGGAGLDHETIALRLPLGLTREDMDELLGGAWKAHVEAVSPPDIRERLLWGMRRGEPWVFKIRADSYGFKGAGEPLGSWIKGKGVEWLARRCELAREAFEAMEGAGLAKPTPSPAGRNLGWMAARLGVDPAAARDLARFANLARNEGGACHGLEWMVSEGVVDRGMSVGEMLARIFEAMGMESREVLGAWEPEGPWVRCGILRPARSGDSFETRNWMSNTTTMRHNAKMFSSRMFGEQMDVMDKPWGCEAELMSCFYRPFEAGGDAGLDLSDWGHVGEEVADIAKAVGRAPVKILLWGEPGSGKSSLAAALARRAGLVAIEPSQGPQGEWRFKGNDLGLMRMWAVQSAEKLACAVGRPMLVVDECEPILTDEERKLEIAKCLEGRTSPQVWIANSLKGAHEAYLRRFDFVLRVPPMPLALREALALRSFADPKLATRMAQSMRNPSEIVAAATWCAAAGEESWGVVSRRMAGHQHAVGASKSGEDGGFEVVPAGGSGLGLEDFAGSERLRGEIVKIAGFFADPGRFAKLGAKIPKGYLLSGPAGSGKTWFVRVLAAVAGVPMVLASGAALAESPERFADLFSEARKRSPCLVFVDEFDVCAGHARVGGVMNLERQKILNRLLVELDGFDPLEGVLFLGATHNGGDVDEAVRRSGRLGRELAFSDPGPEARTEIWRAHLPQAVAGADVDWGALSECSRGFSNAEIAEAAERGKLEAASTGLESVPMGVLARACDEVFWGEPGELYMDAEERWRAAVHEAGHALAALRRGRRPERATVRPRRGFLGAVSVMSKEGSLSMDMSGVRAELSILLAGYAAEKALLGAPGNGARGDLARARGLLEDSLLEWGLGDGPKAFLGGGDSKALSDKATAEFEKEAERRMGAALGELESLFEQERSALERLAKELAMRKELTRKEIEDCVGEPPPMRSESMA